MTVRWGVLGTGGIARTVVDANPGAFVAAASRSADRAAAFGLPFGGTYDELLNRDDVDAVYIALPNSLHPEWTIRALRAGKHVLCEKPFAATRADALAMAGAAGDLVCTEGFMWRLHPQTTLARRLVADGAIGDLAHIRAALRITSPPGDVRRNPSLGGGAFSDLGCYGTSALRLFGGEPLAINARATFDGVDIRFAALAELPGGVTGAFDAALDLPRADELELIGTEGTLRIPDPWICGTASVELVRKGTVETIRAEPGNPYTIEIETVSAAIAGGEPLEFGPADAVAQATAYEAMVRAATPEETVSSLM